MSILDPFWSNDISVADATCHLWEDLDRAALLEARLRPTKASLARAREVLAGSRSALAREAFLARPLSRKGAHDEALAVRLEGLRATPRWDPFQSGVGLTGAAESLLALGRAEEALAVSREAARHAPLDPFALRAWAKAARAAEQKEEAAAVGAWLRDAGYGAPIVEGPPREGEADADGAAPGLDAAALDHESMARFLTLAEVDDAFESKRWRTVRHAMALLRHGEPGLARNVAAGDDGDSLLTTTLGHWMGLLPADELAWLTREALRDALDRTAAGAEARRGAGSKTPNRLWSHEALGHLGYRNRLVKEGSPRDWEALLFSPSRPAFLAGLGCLPSHPIVVRFHELRSALVARFPPALTGQLNRGARTTLGLDDRSVNYPADDTEARAEMPPIVETLTNAKSRCRLCKQAMPGGSLALRTGGLSPSDGSVSHKRAHLACAAGHPASVSALERALERARRKTPEILAIEAQLLPPQPASRR